MANTTEDKLRLLVNNKISIKNAIISAGVPVSESTPLSGYAELIMSINNVIDSTPTEDLIVMCDLYEEVYLGTYKEHTYSEIEQNDIINLLNLIVEGV